MYSAQLRYGNQACGRILRMGYPSSDINPT